MKTFLYTFLTVMAALAVSPSFGQSPEGVPGVSVSDLKMSRAGSLLTVSMELDLSRLDVESNRAVILTPLVTGQGDSLELPSVPL